MRGFYSWCSRLGVQWRCSKLNKKRERERESTGKDDCSLLLCTLDNIPQIVSWSWIKSSTRLIHVNNLHKYIDKRHFKISHSKQEYSVIYKLINTDQGILWDPLWEKLQHSVSSSCPHYISQLVCQQLLHGIGWHSLEILPLPVAAKLKESKIIWTQLPSRKTDVYFFKLLE